MARRFLITAILAIASVLASAVPATAGVVLGVHADPGARGATTRLHRTPPTPWLAPIAPLATTAATHKKPLAALPTITKVRPLKLAIGAKLTIFGHNFVKGKRRNTVVFLRSGAPAIFLKVDTATKTRLTLTLTSKLSTFLITRNNGQKGPTRFRLRVLSLRFGAHFTPTKLSPTISPAPAAPPTGGKPAAPACSLATAKAAPAADADGDGLSNGLELQVNTDPCNADSDGDKVTDGYEYQSALDLNSRALPYPGKRPYPNALDPTDAGVDYDGDGLTLSDEYAGWVTYGGKSFPLNYSDGTQTSGGALPTPASMTWADINQDGFLTDDEKDIDGDGLTNWDEAHGRMQPDWWTLLITSEKPFTVKYLATDWLDPDTDGDTLLDGLDDVDHDGYTNANEVDRNGTLLWVQPFNPCVPDPQSRTCPLHPPPTEASYPPFGSPGMTSGEAIPLVWPRPVGP